MCTRLPLISLELCMCWSIWNFNISPWTTLWALESGLFKFPPHPLGAKIVFKFPAQFYLFIFLTPICRIQVDSVECWVNNLRDVWRKILSQIWLPTPPKKLLQLTNTGKHPLGRGKCTKISHTIGQISLFIGMGMPDSEIT